MSNLLLIVIALLAVGCGPAPLAPCEAAPTVRFSVARCGFALTNTTAGYVYNYFPTPENTCGNVKPMADGVYRNVTQTCFFTVSQNGTEISEERDSK